MLVEGAGDPERNGDDEGDASYSMLNGSERAEFKGIDVPLGVE
jgi:hypothetical protein